MLDPSQISLLHPLQGQGSYESSAYTRPILRSQDLNGILLLRILLLGPVQNLPQGQSSAGLEVGVLVKDGSIGADVAGLVAFLLADCRDAAGREAGRSGTNEFG